MKSIIAISDLHFGSTMGLCPYKVAVVDKGIYEANRYQRTLQKYWQHFWREFVPAATKGVDGLILVINGDVIDNVHHGTTNILSNSIQVQESVAIEALLGIKLLCPTPIDAIYLVKGTEAHAGLAGECEERIGKAIGTETNESGEHAYYELWLQADQVLFHFAHHIGVTSSAAYETSAPMREMIAGLIEAAQWGRKLPNVFVRSHRHRFVEVPIPTVSGRIRTVITPGWQIKTPFYHRIDRMRMPHIGGIVFCVEDDQCQVKEKLYPLPLPKPVQI